MSIDVTSGEIITDNQIKRFQMPILFSISGRGLLNGDTNAISVHDLAVDGIVLESMSQKMAALNAASNMSRIIPNHLKSREKVSLLKGNGLYQIL